MTIDRGLLPRQVQEQLRVVDKLEREIAAYVFKHPRRGPKKIYVRPPFVMFITDNEDETTRQMLIFANAVGKKSRGNKRIGRAGLYAELVKYFLLLKRNNTTLPRNKSLSKKACLYGLGEILRRYNCCSESDNLILRSGEKRNKIAAKMDRVFSRVADSVENTPA